MRVLLIVVAALLITGCATTGATPAPFPRPGGAPEGPSAAGQPTAGRGAAAGTRAGGYEISGTALALRGLPYRTGGSDTTGFDCSGLVWYVFAEHGIRVPRTVAEQYRAGRSVPPSDLRAGDLVFFSTTDPGASHVGIVVGGDAFVHAPTSSGVVRVENLSASYWSSRYVGARRIE